MVKKSKTRKTAHANRKKNKGEKKAQKTAKQKRNRCEAREPSQRRAIASGTQCPVPLIYSHLVIGPSMNNDDEDGALEGRGTRPFAE